MSVTSVFIVVPSLRTSGPVKGAIALCNGLVDHFQMTLVPLKLPLECIRMDPRVKLLPLARRSSWKEKHDTYRDTLCLAGGRDSVVSLSFCFSADALNVLMADSATIISSVRGNLLQNYRFDYGCSGVFLAVLHYLLLRRFDKVIAMSGKMEQQLRRFGIRRLVTIGNFIDEINLEPLRLKSIQKDPRLRFVFLASLSRRKRPELLINAIHTLQQKGMDCTLDLIGDGPLYQSLKSLVRRLDLDSKVTMHGHLTNPYPVLQQGHYMVSTSESEGISRAALEALFFGIPCILRDVDANRDLITPGLNGDLFAHDEGLVRTIARAAENRAQTKNGEGTNLLPNSFRQEYNIQQFLKLINP